MKTTRRLASVLALIAGTALSALAQPGTLLLTTDNEQQQIEIIVGPQAGREKVIGIDGISSNQVFTGITTIDLRTGTNLDAIEFRMYGTVFPVVRVNTGLGDSDVKFIYDIGSAGRSTTVVSHLGGSGHDKLAFEVINNGASNLAARWGAQHGAGDNEFKVAVNSDDATNSINLDLTSDSAGGKDMISTSVIHRANFLSVDVNAAMRAGNDSAIVTIDGLGAAITSLDVNLDLGVGNDVAETIVVSRGGQASIWGTVRGNGGDDLIKLLLEGNGRVNNWMIADAGDDYIDVELKGGIVGRPRLIGGTGEDFLKIVQESRQTSTFIDGGPDIDTAHGFGTIINVENLD